jgi:hypothetical protein
MPNHFRELGHTRVNASQINNEIRSAYLVLRWDSKRGICHHESSILSSTHRHELRHVKQEINIPNQHTCEHHDQAPAISPAWEANLPFERFACLLLSANGGVA